MLPLTVLLRRTSILNSATYVLSGAATETHCAAVCRKNKLKVIRLLSIRNTPSKAVEPQDVVIPNGAGIRKLKKVWSTNPDKQEWIVEFNDTSECYFP
jgi:hypothetical protein